jgi:hypothetical protein
LAADNPGDLSTPPVIARLCFDIWYVAGTLSGARPLHKTTPLVTGDALPPHPERLPHFWATPIEMRELIQRGFDIDYERIMNTPDN